ncbi:LysM peptidoglycan-binding domain-containing protein [Anaerocolumna xylanovorans]|uniref:LysM domain-containing protein n=1 Tax=Anaerocolumna xylanovorans DSM 12503 TaxID=1121345 RepID=A0A1M7Y405_9FIRM|nr:LysM domain-containing protein [Anaerocolumna xylanovorans]SHO46751.1 LysM domain-containing protein [Anaerocolumna xylanovorans DSM 12503]
MNSCPTGTYPYKIQSGDSLWLIAQRYHTTIQEIAAVNSGIDMNNLYIGQIICIPEGYDTYLMILSNHMRLLWEQHVYWTRLVILSMVFGLPDTELVTNRLLRNAKDFEAALIPFYGEAVAAKFAELFTSHLTIAAELVQAAKDNNSTAAADAEMRWYANADQIAAFLGSINPYWSDEEWQSMLYDHLAMTKEEAVYLLTKNYEDSIAVFENIEQEALDMADMMTQGIVRQFPQYFG